MRVSLLNIERKSGITLIELTVVVVIVGILATLAIPTFLRAMQTTRVREAISSLEQIKAGEIIFYNEENTYWAAPAGTAIEKIRSINDNLKVYLDVRDNRNWNYDVDFLGTQLTATATRRGTGPYSGEGIIFNQDGLDKANSNWTGPWP